MSSSLGVGADGNRCVCLADRVVQGAPECMSYTFNADGKCTSFTGGARRYACKSGSGVGSQHALLHICKLLGALAWALKHMLCCSQDI